MNPHDKGSANAQDKNSINPHDATYKAFFGYEEMVVSLLRVL